MWDERVRACVGAPAPCFTAVVFCCIQLMAFVADDVQACRYMPCKYICIVCHCDILIVALVSWPWVLAPFEFALCVPFMCGCVNLPT
jgi:hypothetical protein